MPTPFFNPAWPFLRIARDERELEADAQVATELAELTTDAPVPDDPKGSEAWFDEGLNIFDVG